MVFEKLSSVTIIKVISWTARASSRSKINFDGADVNYVSIPYFVPFLAVVASNVPLASNGSEISWIASSSSPMPCFSIWLQEFWFIFPWVQFWPTYPLVRLTKWKLLMWTHPKCFHWSGLGPQKTSNVSWFLSTFWVPYFILHLLQSIIRYELKLF